MRSYSPSLSLSPSLTSDTGTHTTPPVSTGVGVGSSGTGTASGTGTMTEVSPYLLELQQGFVDKIKVCMVYMRMCMRMSYICVYMYSSVKALVVYL